MPFQIVRNDITKVRADAIVNTANPEPVYGGGTDSAVYKAAGAERLLAERKKIGPIPAGEAAVTPAFALPARFIIHTVGPVWKGGKCGEYRTLASCYRKSLLLARQLRCESIAFPLISTGVYGFPKDRALSIALEEIERFLEDSEMDVTLVVFDKRAFELSSELSADVRQFIDENYVSRKREEEFAHHTVVGSLPDTAEKRRRREGSLWNTGELPPLDNIILPYPEEDGAFLGESESLSDHSYTFPQVTKPEPFKASLSDVMRHMGETFQERLLRLIDERGLSDAEVYKKANVDRKLFSKIRCRADYTPGKRTAVALAVALELNLDETIDLLRRAGIALSPSSKFDLIVEYCIENRIYSIYEINSLLFEYDQPMLGC